MPMTRRQRIACLLMEARRELEVFCEEQDTVLRKSFAVAMIIAVDAMVQRIQYGVPVYPVALYAEPIPMPALNGGGDGE